MRPTLVHTLTEKDAKQQRVIVTDPFGRKHWLWADFGPVLPGDVGKRIYAVLADDGQRYVLQVESDSQRDKRLSKEK